MNATATDVKNRFGEFMDRAQREPVTVDKSGRSYAVLLSFEEYQRLLAAEDALWVARADKAAESGFLSTEESMALLEKALK